MGFNKALKVFLTQQEKNEPQLNQNMISLMKNFKKRRKETKIKIFFFR